MSNARKKVKAEKKAKARRDKAKRAKAQRIVEKKAGSDREQSKSQKDQSAFKSIGQQAGNKPSSRSNTPERRTQGK